jgi:hypothetical protein
MVNVHVERTINALPDNVFDWLADPANLTTAPLLFRARYLDEFPGPGVGAVRAAIGAGIWVHEKITAYDRPNSYSYLIVQSLPAFGHDGGMMRFVPTGTGTHVSWDSAYHHPTRWGGGITDAITAPLLRWNFQAVLDACAKQLE